MSSNEYNLTWPTFNQNLVELMNGLYKEEDSKDVTFVFDDQSSLKSHKFLLKHASYELRTILIQLNESQPVLQLPGVKSQSMAFILQFLYLGQVSIQEDDVADFLNTARKLKIKELYKPPEPEQKANVNPLVLGEDAYDQKPLHEFNPSQYNAKAFNNSEQSTAQSFPCHS